ncbi:MAG: glycine zipper 2TM domain-containing protein [Chromatiales bacterium]|nr:glycine zipper 2TM domain-containing protein [Chromatiales bacterium]
MKKTLLATSLGLLVISGTAMAERSFHDRAKVLNVEPVYAVVQVNRPEERCWTETVRYRERGYGRDSATPTITGAIIGGVVGNQFGKGSGNKAMTAAGAILGASVGHDIGKRGHSDSYVTKERRCEVVDNYEEREELTGYRVKYRYAGKTFWTTTDEHPGKFLPVRVEVSPRY